MRPILIATIAGVLALAACKEDIAEPSSADTISPDVAASSTVDVASINSVADLPRRIVVDNDHIKADITFDEAMFAKAPNIAMDIVDDAQVRLEALDADAVAYKEADPEYFRPYGLRIEWNVVAEAGDVMSLEGFTYTFTGGAHGNYFTDARIYNSLTGELLRMSSFFDDPQEAISAHLNRVHTGYAEQKVLKSGDASKFRMFTDEAAELIDADMVRASEISLLPSTEAGKFGGYAVHFAPYEIGSYAEGAYHVTVPQSAFHDDLKAEYANLFAGEPAPVVRADN